LRGQERSEAMYGTGRSGSIAPGPDGHGTIQHSREVGGDRVVLGSRGNLDPPPLGRSYVEYEPGVVSFGSSSGHTVKL
jgi:hypothetical protein